MRALPACSSFGPWLGTARKKRITENVLDEVSRDIPSDGMKTTTTTFCACWRQVYRRRTRVPELLLDAKRCNRQPFSQLDVNHG